MIQDVGLLREKLIDHSMKHPGSLKEIAARIGISYPGFRKFMQPHVKTVSFETMCKINQYIATYKSSDAMGPLTVRQTCDLHNGIRACKLGTQATMHKLCDLLGIEDISEIDASRFAEAMRCLDYLNK